MWYLYHLRFRHVFGGEGGCKRRAGLWRARGKMNKERFLLNELWTRGAGSQQNCFFLSQLSCSCSTARVEEFLYSGVCP